MRAAAFVLAFLALAGCGEDPVPKLEAELAALVARTRPKAEFWAEVERKGSLMKEQRELENELSRTRTAIAALAPEREQLAAAIAQSRQTNALSEDALTRNRAEAGRLEAEVAIREARVGAFAARRSAPGVAP